jgi:hypothetical protein
MTEKLHSQKFAKGGPTEVDTRVCQMGFGLGKKVGPDYHARINDGHVLKTCILED